MLMLLYNSSQLQGMPEYYMTCSARCTPLTEKARSKHNVKILRVYRTLDFFALSAAVLRNKSNEARPRDQADQKEEGANRTPARLQRKDYQTWFPCLFIQDTRLSLHSLAIPNFDRALVSKEPRSCRKPSGPFRGSGPKTLGGF